MNLAKLICEAHGCEMPVVEGCYAGMTDDGIVYHCYLPQWGVDVDVELPKEVVCALIMAAKPHFDPVGMHREYVEAYVHDCRPRPQDVVAYMLRQHHRGEASPSVTEYLEGRFGPMLTEAAEQAEEWF